MSKPNRTGRTSTKRKLRKSKIAGQFAPRTIDMLESPAFCVLSLSGRRVLDRLEIELAHHAGTNNGGLVCTFDDFERYGIHRHSIGPAVRECVALGFVEITVIGRAGNGEYRTPTKYRLTYRHTEFSDPSNQWRRIKTIEDARETADKARQAAPRKNKKPVAVSALKPVAETTTENGNSPVAETATTVSVQNPPLLSISPRNPACCDPANRGAVFAAYRTLAIWSALVLAEGPAR